MTTLTIPDVPTVIPREEWERFGYRMAHDFTREPPPLVIRDVIRGAIHYTSVIDLADGDPPDELVNGYDDIISLLGRMGVDYYRNRQGGNYVQKGTGTVMPGYAVGYNFAVDWLGRVYELRGFDYRSAATNQHNYYTLAVLQLTDRHDPPTPAMARSTRAILREAKRRGAPLLPRPWGHREFYERTNTGTPTACPGDPIMQWINDGKYDLDYQESNTYHKEGNTMNPIELVQADRRIQHSVNVRPNVPIAVTVPDERAVTGDFHIHVIGAEVPGALQVTALGSAFGNTSDGMIRHSDGTYPVACGIGKSIETDQVGIRIRTTVPCIVIVDLQRYWRTVA